MRKIIIVAISICLFLPATMAQKGAKKSNSGYEIKFHLDPIKDSVLYVANYYADKTYMFDSIYRSPKNPEVFVFKGDSLLPRGVYIIAGQDKSKYFDFIVDSSTHFTATAKNLDPDYPDFIKELVYTGSPENNISNRFFQTMSGYQRTITAIGKEIKELEAEKKPDNKTINSKKEEIRAFQDSILAYTSNFVDQYGERLLFGKIQRLAQEVDVPDAPKDKKGNLLDSNFAFSYYINHFWDNCDFTDEAIINTPIFQPRLELYFSKVVPPLPDSINKYADLLIEKMKDNQELFKYTVWFITHKYERSQYVGHDAVFVHMVNNYYAKGLCPWTDEAVLERMVNHANHLEKILLGKTAPELAMFDVNDQLVSNYSLNKDYTIMWFWDLNCGHCKTATPKLVELYNRIKDEYNIGIYAVCKTQELDKWKQTIEEKGMSDFVNVGGNRATIDFVKVYGINSTPYMFVLDKDKKIICKKIGVEELENFLRNHKEGKRIY